MYGSCLTDPWEDAEVSPQDCTEQDAQAKAVSEEKRTERYLVSLTFDFHMHR